MKILIEGYNKSIHKRDNQILIKEKDVEIEKININKIKDITIIGKGYITFDALRLISDNNVRLMSIDYFGKINYTLEYLNYDNIFLRKQQYKISESYQGLNIAREIIKSKMINQKSTLKTLNKNKKIKSVDDFQNNINESLKQLDKLRFGEKTDLNKAKMKIMGIEGSASVDYWLAINELLPKNIRFFSRNNRHPDDITNASLNYPMQYLQVKSIRLLSSMDLTHIVVFCISIGKIGQA